MTKAGSKRGEKLLNDRQVLTAKATGKPYRLHDGGGLALNITAAGVKSWQYRYRLADKDQTATLGRYPDVGLAEARELVVEARKLAAKGEHLTTEKRAAKAGRIARSADTFAKASEAWAKREARRAEWSDDYREEVKSSLRNHLSDLNALPVARITARIVAPTMRKAERVAPDMAKKVRARLRAILDYAVEEGQITANPIPAPRRTKSANKRKHLPAVLDREGVGQILRAADKAELSRGVRRAHLLAVFTAQRIGEIVGAEWSEIDFTTATWTIPRSRMKRKDVERGPHVLPIPPRLLSMMQEWKRVDGDDARWVCPAPQGKGTITREAVEKFYRRGLGLAGKHSPHSWRSVFDTWSGDAGKGREGIDAQLDHVIGNKVRQAYDRANRLELRRPLLAWYESEIVAARDGAQVLPLKRPA